MKNGKQLLRTFIIIVVLSVNIGCDQISKHVVRNNIDYKEQISLLDHRVILTKVENTGAFLSTGHSLPQPVKLVLLTILPLIVLLLAITYIIKKEHLSTITLIGICFVVGGGIGNIYDRLLYGSVTDFLHIDFILFETGIFNMADVSIMMGVFMILIESFIKKKSWVH